MKLTAKIVGDGVFAFAPPTTGEDQQRIGLGSAMSRQTLPLLGESALISEATDLSANVEKGMSLLAILLANATTKGICMTSNSSWRGRATRARRLG